MSSREFESIFDNAAAITRIRCKGMPGVEVVLSSIRQRVMSGGESDPRKNRDLFFEPWIEAQRLGVPEDTAEGVARQLLELRVLRLWTRLRCSSSPPDEDATILETDSDEALKNAMDDVCAHCGGIHNRAGTLLEAVYAPNFPEGIAVAPFDSRHLYPVATIGSSPSQSDASLRRLESIARMQVASGGSIYDIAVVALDQNSAPERVPSPLEAWMGAWLGPCIIVVLFLVLIIPISRCTPWWTTILATVVVLGVIWLVISGEVKKRLAPSAGQRSVVRWGISVAVALVGGGTTGFEFTLNEENKLKVPIWNNQQITLPMRFELGTANYWLVGSGVLCLCMTFLFVLIYDQKIGWFVRER